MFNKYLLKTLPVLNIGFLVAVAILALLVGLSPTINKFGLYQQTLVIFSLASVVAATLMMLASYRSSSRLRKYYPAAIIIAFAISLGVQVCIAIALTSYGYTWDSERIFNEASLYARSGSVSDDFEIYIRSNPNNIALVTGLGLFFKALSHFGVDNFLLAASLLNTFVLFLTQIIIFLVAYLLYGRRIAAISIIFSFVFLSLSMHVQTPYTDTLAIFFPIAIFLLFLLTVGARTTWVKILLSAAIGAVAAIGCLIKPTVIIAIIALILAGTVWLIAYRNKQKSHIKTSLYCSISLILAAALVVFGFARTVDAVGILPYKYSEAAEYAKPATHFIAMGMRTTIAGNSHNYGGYNEELSDTIIGLQTPEAKLNYSIFTIQKQLQEYGPINYLGFLGNKIRWIMSDATFFAYGEGDNNSVVFYDNGELSSLIRQFMFVEGRHFQLFSGFLQVFWVALLLLITMQLYFVLMNRMARHNAYTSILRLMILGILLFLLVFEGRSRYILLYVPIFIILALYTLRWFKETPVPEKSVV